MSLSRRAFIRQAACAGVGTAGIASTIWYLRAMNAAAGLNLRGGPVTDTGGITPGDYKALVCVFLYGGNDSANVLLPLDTPNYNAYQSARGILALPQNSIRPINAANASGVNAGQFGVHPSMPEIQALFNSGKAAFIANTGSLAAPVTRATYLNGSAQLPPQLFSHEDQQIQWQTSWPDSPSRTGWGGRLADLLNTLNSGSVSMSISAAGTNTFEVGNQISQYQVGSNGSVALNNLGATNDARYVAYNNIVNLPYTNLFEKAFAATTRRAIDNNALISTALAAAPALATVFPANSNLANQLKIIARLISIRSNLGHRRQIYFVSQGGYDTHAEELDNHGPLLADLSASLNAFYNATVELNVANMVTAFTASDFGRTFTSNGQGSDHGWGGHHIVVGGDVRGGDVYGRYPILSVNGPDDTGYGRWIPSTAVDEYSMKLATWFGITPGQMSTVFPNIGRFNAGRADLNFMS